MPNRQEGEHLLINKNQKGIKLLGLFKATALSAVGLGIAAAVLGLIGIVAPPLILPAIILGVGAITFAATSLAMKQTYKERVKIGFYSGLSDEAVTKRQVELKASNGKDKNSESVNKSTGIKYGKKAPLNPNDWEQDSRQKSNTELTSAHFRGNRHLDLPYGKKSVSPAIEPKGNSNSGYPGRMDEAYAYPMLRPKKDKEQSRGRDSI